MVKKVNMVLFSTVTELIVLTPYCEMQVTVTLCHTEPAGTGTVSRNCNSQLVLFTTEWQRELQLVAAFLKICLEQRSVQTEIS